MAPTLVAPDGRSELGPMLRSFSAFRYPPSVLGALDVIPPGDLYRRAPEAAAAVGPIERCPPARPGPGPAGIERDRQVRQAVKRRPGDNIAVPSTAWEAAFIADEQVLLEGWPDKSKTRWVLNFNEHAAYTRLCTLVLDDVVEYVVVDTRDGFIGYETGSAAFSR